MKRQRTSPNAPCNSNNASWWALLWTLLLSILSPGLSDNRQLLGLRGGPLAALEEETEAYRLNKNVPAPPSANVTVPLHAHSGTHHVHIYIGSPPQRQTLIVDTGSRIMAFACKPCRSCGTHASPYFDPSLSTTYRVSKCGNCLLDGIATCSMFGDQCEISQKYTEGSSWSASEVEDIVWFGTSSVLESIEDHMQLAIPYAFGCQTSSKGLFKKQYADGILGLARHETSIIAAYTKAGAIPRNAFGLCLTPNGGHLSLGGTMPTQHHIQPMRMTPITRENGWYSVQVVTLLVGDTVVASSDTGLSLLKAVNAGKGCLLDSGTTDTYLPASLAKAFGKAALAWTNGLTDFSSKARKKAYSFQDFQQLPEITFVMANNVTLTMHAENYMEGVPFFDGDTGTVQPWAGTKSLANRVYLEEAEGAVLGANAMFGYDILFDAQGHQIGIAKADCAATVASTIS
jgi:hypothetical protein